MPADITIAEAAHRAGIFLEQPCGGNGKCGKCRVRVERVSGMEDEVPACRAEVGGIRKVWSESPGTAGILIDGMQRALEFNPFVRQVYVKPAPPSLANPVSDTDRLLAALAEQDRSGQAADGVRGLGIKCEILPQVPELLHQKKGVTVTLIEREVIALEAGEVDRGFYGMAFDLGTTTLVGYLLDLRTGEQLAVTSILNPQTRMGLDVISRIQFGRSPEGLDQLHRSMISAVNGLIRDAAGQAGVKREDVYEVVVVGNTTMQHLFCGISPYYLGRAPYLPVVDHALCLEPARLDLDMCPRGRVFVFPALAGFVGGDTLAAILAANQNQRPEITLLVDIGTNGEIVLGNRDGLVACSAAAGPAFEGAGIGFGMRGAPGAIERVSVTVQGVDVKTIAGQPARGICGSGLIDAVAGLVEQGLVSSRGRLVSDQDLAALPGSGAFSQLIRGRGLERAITLVGAAESAHDQAITLSQKDIQELQLAKGAIRASVELLCRERGVTPEEIKEIFLAGTFGAYVNPQKAITIGLLPKLSGVPITSLGNAAGEGAKRALLSQDERNQLHKIKEITTCVDLVTRTNFETEYIEALFFSQ